MDRWFSEWDVSFAIEGKMQTRAKEHVQDYLVGKNGAFSFLLKDRGEEVRIAPHVYVSSLWDKLQTLLDQHERYNYSPLP